MDRTRRGQAGVLGVALLLGIVLTGMVLVVTLGSTAITETKGHLNDERAAKTLTQLDSQAALVALGATDHQRIDLATGGGGNYHVHDRRGWMNVTITNTTNGVRNTTVNESLGAITYTNDGTTVAYQGGGVWRQQDDTSVMVSPPEFHYRNATLTLPIVSLNGTGNKTLSGGIVVERNGESLRRFPNETVNGNVTNPLDSGRVNVTVHSEYYRAWGRYFEERTEGTVDYDHDRKTVTVTLTTPAGPRKVTNAVAATDSSASFSLAGNGAKTDSYTSADGDGYVGDVHDRGNVTVAGPIDIGGSACVKGDLKSGESISLTGGGTGCPASTHQVVGDGYYTTTHSTSGSTSISGTWVDIDGVDGSSNVDSYVDQKETEIGKPSNNANASTAAIQNGELVGSATLGPGNYYFERLKIHDGDTLELDPDGGEITIVVQDYISLVGGGFSDSSLKVVSDGQVKIYVQGRATDDDGYHVHLGKKSTTVGKITTQHQNATQLWIYGKSDMKATIEGASGTEPELQGVLYAPSTSSGTSSVTVQHANVYGGLVAGNVNVEQGGAVHYDTALQDYRTIPKGTDIVSITYMHISVNRIDVADR